MENKRRFNLNRQFLLLTVIPTICMGFIIMLFSYTSFNNTLTQQINLELENLGSAVTTYFDLTYPGDYSLVSYTTSDGLVAYDLQKGNRIITREYQYLDLMKKSTGMDITIFYEDTRILTTLVDGSGARLVGTPAHPLIVDDVLSHGKEHFYKKALVNSHPYFAYYAPLRNENGTIVGMIFTGKPTTETNRTLRRALLPMVLIAIASMLITGAISVLSSRKLSSVILKINRFLSNIALGSLNTTLDPKLLARSDELGDIGRSALRMQRSLCTLVEQDTLTGLHNRRYAEEVLHQLIRSCRSQDASFTLAIGDIDHFKNVNDTYGHEGGDVVLKKIADIMKKHMEKKGCAARWGGEEFLIVYENLSYKEAVSNLHALAEEIRQTPFTYREHTLHITMTFGVAVGRSRDNLNILLKNADDKLYKGKENGRDQIVT